MIKIRILALFLLFVMLFSFVGCASYTAYKDYYHKADDYETIWSLSGFRHDYGYGTVPPLFPSCVDDLNVNDFFCRYDQQLPLGEGFQIYLEVQYSDSAEFESEVRRIESIAYNCDEYFADDNNSTHYATRLGTSEDVISEYAIVKSNEMTISYLYLENIPRNELEIDEKNIPIGYTDYGAIEQ